jgi:hypothetical protein
MKKKYFDAIKNGAEKSGTGIKAIIKFPLKFLIVFVIGGILMFIGILIWQFFKPINNYFRRCYEEDKERQEPYYNRISKRKRP